MRRPARSKRAVTIVLFLRADYPALTFDAVKLSPRKISVSRLLIICAVSLGLWQTSAADFAISIPIQLTHAQNFDPSPSPDGKKLVFISVISGKEQLFTMDVDRKNIAQLTRDDADHEDPAWSPDGKRSRLFSSQRNGPASR